MNTQQVRTKKLSVSIDSLFRQNYYTTEGSNFLYTLPSPIKNVIKMSITALEIPHFWYQYNNKTKSNEFTITVFNYKITDPTNSSNPPIDVPSTTYVITMPDGNYMNVDMVNFLMNYFTNVGEGLAYMFVEIDVNSGTTVFRARHPTDSRVLPSPFDPTNPYYSPTFYFTLDFRVQSDPERPIYKNFGWSMGFNKPFYTIMAHNTYSTRFTNLSKAEVVYNAFVESEMGFGSSFHNYIFLDIDDFNKGFSNDNIISCLPDSYLVGNNIIARITITSGSNSINLSSAADAILKSREYYGPVTISQLNIRLLDRYGDVIDINRNDMSFLIEFTILDQ